VNYFINSSFSSIVDEISLALSAQGTRGIELFRQVTAYIVGTIVFPDYRVVFASWGLLYGAVLMSFLRLLRLDAGPDKLALLPAMLLILIAIFIPVTETVNGRFWLGAFIWIFSCYRTFARNDRIFLLVGLVVPFIHQGLGIAAAALLVFFFLRHWLSWRSLLLLFVPAVIISNFSAVGVLLQSSGLIGGGVESHAVGYLGQASGEQQLASLIPTAERLWWLMWRDPFLLFTSGALLLWLRVRYGSVSGGSEQYLAFTIFFAGIVVSMQGIPSAGGRYLKIGLGLILVSTYLHAVYVSRFRRLRWQAVALFPAFALYLVVTYRLWGEFWDAKAFLAGPMLSWAFPTGDSIADYVKYTLGI
jgi:hypothetical protein